MFNIQNPLIKHSTYTYQRGNPAINFMASLQTSSLLSSSSCSSIRKVNAALHVPKPPRVAFSVPQVPKGKLVEEFNRSIDTVQLEKNVIPTQTYDGFLYKANNNKSKATVQLYAILEAVADRIEMHSNVGEQRDNWNSLLLNSINMITLTATTMAGVAAATAAGAPLLALKLTSALLFSAAAGLLLVMNKIQPSQLAEEQRNATRLFRQLQTQIQTSIALGNPAEEDVKSAMEKVLALDKAYPLPLLGAMLDKFPAKFEPAVWWPSTQFQKKNNSSEGKAQSRKMGNNRNGWSEEIEMELREVIEVVKRKDSEDYERLGNMALKINKTLAIAGPFLTGIAAAGSAFVGNGSWAALVPLTAGSLAAAINTFEHGGQVGMVFEMYRNSAGFFKMLETSIESTLEENDLERRENGELFEMKMALQLGRSVPQLKELASKSASYRVEGIAIDEFASKLF